ncbi:MAG: DEAD/DEAH box helicase [Kiritimatiellae bacterium]|nr:DEAD/DEAH box helicase [Kiritimatiellia bacterium]
MKKASEIKVSAKWMTTDTEERALRKKRALSETMSVRPLQKSRKEIFQNYEVRRKEGGEAAKYVVELRSLDSLINSCTCPDFLKSGLGTCKHIERVLISVRSPKRSANRTSPGVELFMTRDPYEPIVMIGSLLTKGWQNKLQKLIDVEGRIRHLDAANLSTAVDLCEELSGTEDVAARVSVEVKEFLESLRTKERLADFESQFREEMVKNKGALPFLKMPLYPYQFDGVLHLAFKGRAMLADEMGLGKTVQAVAAAAIMREVMQVQRVLVIAPASLKAEWEDQIRLFTDLDTEVLFGSRPERLKRYQESKAFFMLANYEQVLRDYHEINTIMRPTLVILDEAQRIKNWKTKTARALKKLESRFAFVLTGTPLENRIDELYSLTEFVDPTIFGSLFRFNRKYYRFDDFGKIDGMQNLDDLHENVKKVMLRRLKTDISEQLPERVDNTYFVKMTPEQRKRYAEHEVIVAALVSASKRRPLRPEEMDRLQVNLACMRMCCDTCYILDPKIKAAPKLDELERVLEDIWSNDPERKVLIFSEWVRMLELVQERLDKMEVGFALHIGAVPQRERRVEIKRFKSDPECRVFLSSESGGVGLNLQSASVVLNLDLPWNPAKLEQRIARAWRKHQTRTVNVINLVSEATIEHKMLDTLKFKQGLADAVLDSLGDFETFEKSNAKSVFMERLAEVMDSTVQVEPSSASKEVKPLEPNEQLKLILNKGESGIDSCAALFDEQGKPDALLAVGEKGGEKRLRSLIQETHGVALPPSRVVTITPEIQALLENLEGLGFIKINSGKAETLFSSGRAKPAGPSKEHIKRCARAEKQLQAGLRDLKMAEVLLAGEFQDEALAAARKAVAVAAGVIYLFTSGVEVEAEVDPLNQRMLDVLKSDKSVDREQVSLIQMAFFEIEAEVQSFVEKTRGFIASCKERLEVERVRG